MINSNILENFNYDINEIRGWAFGAGLERIVMLKYKIDDLRLFFENDISFYLEVYIELLLDIYRRSLKYI